MGKVRRCIHIYENISVILMYRDRCHQNYPPKHISDVDSTYNVLYNIIFLVESKGCVVNPLDVRPPPGLSVHRDSLGPV